MAYRPHLPAFLTEAGHIAEISGRSPMPGRPVTPVTAVTGFLEMSLSQFEREGCPIQIKVPRLPETIWFVPGEADVAALAQRGIARGRIWSASELRMLWGGGFDALERAHTLARIKRTLDAEVVSVEKADQADGSKEPTRG